MYKLSLRFEAMCLLTSDMFGCHRSYDYAVADLYIEIFLEISTRFRSNFLHFHAVFSENLPE